MTIVLALVTSIILAAILIAVARLGIGVSLAEIMS